MRPRALVTGAAVRVGRAIAVELARSGFDVAVHYGSRADEAEETAVLCRAHGATAFTVGGDLAEVAGCAAVVAAVLGRWDALNLLVNNASVFFPTPFADLDAATWDRVLAVNLRAPFLLARGLLGALRAADGALLAAPAGQHGVVVHLCDVGAERPIDRHAPYSVSKAGLVGLVRAMAVELAPAVRTVGISPGQVAWPESYDDEKRRRLARRIPLGRPGAPEDVARLVRFLACEAHYVNGAVVPLDGGISVRY